MKLDFDFPIIYLITDGTLPPSTNIEVGNRKLTDLIELIKAAVEAGVSLIQIREKHLPANVLYELTRLVASLTKKSNTRLLVNDRADVAQAAGADGVHLTAQSLPANIVREKFGSDFLVGVSTHTIDEARDARDRAANFITFSPVFDTASKAIYDLPPVGLEALRRCARELESFSVIALGGITTQAQIESCLDTGARGIAAIKLFQNPASLNSTVEHIRLHTSPDERPHHA